MHVSAFRALLLIFVAGAGCGDLFGLRAGRARIIGDPKWRAGVGVPQRQVLMLGGKSHTLPIRCEHPDALQWDPEEQQLAIRCDKEWWFRAHIEGNNALFECGPVTHHTWKEPDWGALGKCNYAREILDIAKPRGQHIEALSGLIDIASDSEWAKAARGLDPASFSQHDEPEAITKLLRAFGKDVFPVEKRIRLLEEAPNSQIHYERLLVLLASLYDEESAAKVVCSLKPEDLDAQTIRWMYLAHHRSKCEQPFRLPPRSVCGPRLVCGEKGSLAACTAEEYEARLKSDNSKDLGKFVLQGPYGPTFAQWWYADELDLVPPDLQLGRERLTYMLLPDAVRPSTTRNPEQIWGGRCGGGPQPCHHQEPSPSPRSATPSPKPFRLESARRPRRSASPAAR